MNSKYYDKICEILTQTQKTEARILFDKINLKSFESLYLFGKKVLLY